MAARRKRECFGCRALVEGWYPHGDHCNLRYPVRDERRLTGDGQYVYVTVPDVVCPKPRTYKQEANAPEYKKPDAR